MHRFRIVLSSPRHAGNVAASVRAALNFGFRDLVVAAPHCDLSSPEAEKYATGDALRHYKKLRVTPTLQEAVADCSAVIGFTRRAGKARSATLAPTDLVAMSGEPGGGKGSKIALVFGNEKTGLSAAELRLCQYICSIDTDAGLPSMNLSHAVAAVAALMRYSKAGADLTPGTLRANPLRSGVQSSDFERFMDHWREMLQDAGMTQGGNPDRLMKNIRKFFQRSPLENSDLRLFRGLLSKIQVALGTRSRGKRI